MRYVSTCSTCGHASRAVTREGAISAHAEHMAQAHPEIKMGTVIYV